MIGLVVRIALFLLPLFLLAGCKNADREKLEAFSDFAYDAGLEFEAEGVTGDGHIMGQAFNATGTHFHWRIAGKPTRRSTDVPQPTTGAVK